MLLVTVWAAGAQGEAGRYLWSCGEGRVLQENKAREAASSGIMQNADETWCLSQVCQLLEYLKVFGATSKKKNLGAAILDRGK